MNILLITQPAYSFDNICEVIGKVKYETSVKRMELHKRIKGRQFQGAGKVRDVRPAQKSYDYKVIVGCGNDVILEITSSSAFLKDLKIGQRVSFSGKYHNMRKRFYMDTKEPYILVKLKNASIN